MPLCPQITNTPITVSLTADFTVTDVVPVLPATTEQLDEVVVLIDGKTKAYYQASMPSTGMTEGDLWFDTDDGYKLYYYTGSAWTSVQDAAIATAQSAATAAQTTADGKNKIYRQTSQPTGGTYAEGDLWFDTDDANKMYRYTGGTWTGFTLGDAALASLSATKLTAGTIDASVITVSNLDAGNISTGTLAAARIAAGSLDATKITSGTITATQISSSYVYAGTIAAGNITTGTLSATVALSAISGTIGGFNIGTNYLSTTAGTSSGYWFSTNGDSSFRTVNATGFQMGASGALTMGGGTISGASTISATSTISTNGNMSAGGTMTVTGVFTAVDAGTVTNANTPNAWLSTGGVLRRSTASSLRYKENVTDLVNVEELDPKKLLDLPVRAFTYKENYLPSTDDRYQQLFPGFISEEVDAVYPIAADYENGQVESWNDRLLIPGMLALIQDLYKEIAILKGE
jgi:hypothetical protein